jgi:hypothetical protein
MDLLHGVGHVEPHLGLFGCKIGAWFAPYVPLAQKLFWTNSMVLLGNEAQLEAHLGLSRDSAKLDAR